MYCTCLRGMDRSKPARKAKQSNHPPGALCASTASRASASTASTALYWLTSSRSHPTLAMKDSGRTGAIETE
eukprot:4647839-Prymnesium_polylepis.1